MTSDPTRAVLGAWTGLPTQQAAPFLASLRASGYDGRIVLFVGRTAHMDRRTFDAFDVEIVPVDAEYRSPVPSSVLGALRRLRRDPRLRPLYRPVYRLVARASRARVPGSARADGLEFELQGLQALRYRHYLGYLRDHPSVAAAMICDVRDVVFQSDPLAEAPVGLETFLEDPAVTVGTEPSNRSWVLALHGRRGLARIADEPVSCSGTTVGDRAAMLAYLETMALELSRHVGPLGAHDQGAHNWLLHTGRLPDPTLVPNGTGRVLTMYAMDPPPRAEPDGRVLAADGHLPPVLHQYDRFPELARLVLARYVPDTSS